MFKLRVGWIRRYRWTLLAFLVVAPLVAGGSYLVVAVQRARTAAWRSNDL